MRQLAAYSLTGTPGHDAPNIYPPHVLEVLDNWLKSKGSLAEGGHQIELVDSRVASVIRSVTASSKGRVSDLVLTEPTAGGLFRTTVSVAETSEVLAVSVSLSAGAESLAPLHLDVHCPRLIRELLSLEAEWTYGNTRLSCRPISFMGDQGGDEFVSEVWNTERSVPVVAVSDEYGAILHPGMVEALATDLAGLALVARLDPAASWRITARRGKEWSCYGGAIRLYWPGVRSDSAPFDHPLWTPRRLLLGAADTHTAAGRLRSQLRRRILGQSAFAVAQPPVITQIRRSARQEEIAALRSKAVEDANYEALAEGYFDELVRVNELLEQRDEEISTLNSRISSLELALRWKEAEGEIEPDPETPPSTVEEAVLSAMDRFGENLVFGDAVNRGIRTLAPDAGPPDKILMYLRVLSEFTVFRHKGSLGTTAIKWLEDNGVIASAESETIRKSAEAKQARTWEDGSGGWRTFDLHLKPSDATAPNRCVRIYFEYDQDSRKTIIGWVGAHP